MFYQSACIAAALTGWIWLALAPCVHPAEFEWRTATAESQGMSTARLESLREAIGHNTRALLVIRHDRIVYEWYADGQTADSKQGTASLAKAIIGGLSLAVAMSDGRIALDDPAWKYVPAWKDDPVKSKITVRHLGSHTSGLDDSHNRPERARGIEQGDYTGWAGDFWRWRQAKQRPPLDAFTISRDVAPMRFEPGTDYQYSNPGMAMLTWCVTASLAGTEHSDLRSLLRHRIMEPIGIKSSEWSCGYGLTEEVDGLPMVANWGGGAFTPRAAARIGRLALRRGDWDGQQLISAAAADAMVQDAGLPAHFGMGWWTNADGHFPELPRDAFWGAGAGHQILLVVPSLNLIVVRNGGELRPTGDGGEERSNSDPLYVRLFQPLMQAAGHGAGSASAGAPYPASPVIKHIEWAPADTIIRAAKGSDNWPMTWADDDQLYTAYGDGNGFEPFVPKKLSLGLARISGGPERFEAFNIRSADAEAQGNDVHGRKASGMLMVAGKLYMLARNTGNAQLGWSTDHGRTWQWADWRFTESFGCPTFLNFGKNYSGARDDFVYIYSSDSESAYVPADRMVLARVPQAKLTERAAYEFFVGLDESGQPQWSPDIERRGSVFDYPNRCYRSGVTYNAALKRYLWCQVFPESRHPQGPRFQGGLGVFDAPEPWGPWTTVFFTNDWDVGPGETNSFPTKWMSADGRTIHLVFSGDDHFSVRRAQLTVQD